MLTYIFTKNKLHQGCFSMSFSEIYWTAIFYSTSRGIPLVFLVSSPVFISFSIDPDQTQRCTHQREAKGTLPRCFEGSWWVSSILLVSDCAITSTHTKEFWRDLYNEFGTVIVLLLALIRRSFEGIYIMNLVHLKKFIVCLVLFICSA